MRCERGRVGKYARRGDGESTKYRCGRGGDLDGTGGRTVDLDQLNELALSLV